MREYRFPTSILWINGGYRIFNAKDYKHAMEFYRRQFPVSANKVSLNNLQVKLDEKWQFASNISLNLGGYKP